jgi:major membrane immunogen (membrane-anchored lipoprotein)
MPIYTARKSILFALMIPSVFVLVLAASLLILTVNTSQAFTPQQPPPSTAGQQQQPQAPQANQSVSTQQNTTQSNQSAQQQQQQQIPLNQLVGSEDFTAGGTIDSTIYTTNGNWEATGTWTLTVSEGELTSFDTDMAWNNGTAAHTHEFQNFVMDDGSDNISIDSEGGITIAGVMDVGTNGVVSWPSVPVEITIDQGKIITVSLDHEDTDNHFGGHDQAVHGTVASLKPCSATPGPNMQIPTGAC